MLGEIISDSMNGRDLKNALKVNIIIFTSKSPYNTIKSPSHCEAEFYAHG